MKKDSSITTKLSLAGLVMTLVTGGISSLSAQSGDHAAPRDNHVQERHANHDQDSPRAERSRRDRPQGDVAPAHPQGRRGGPGMRPQNTRNPFGYSGSGSVRRTDRSENNRERPHQDAVPARSEGRRGDQGMRPRSARPENSPARRDIRGRGNDQDKAQSNRRSYGQGVQQRGPQRSGPPWLQGRNPGFRGNSPFQMRQSRNGSNTRPGLAARGPRGPQAARAQAFRSIQARRFGPFQTRGMMHSLQRAHQVRSLNAHSPEKGRPGQGRDSVNRGPSKRGRDSDRVRSRSNNHDRKRGSVGNKKGQRSHKPSFKNHGRGQERGKAKHKNLRERNGKKKSSKGKNNRQNRGNKRNHRSARR